MTPESKPFYSIIIATFNSAATIEPCLHSILQQSFPGFEVLIQDGGSTDGTLRLVQQFNDRRIKLVSGPDSGIYDAMNKAADRMNGQWILFLGSDDSLYHPHILQEIYTVVEQHPVSRFIYGNVFTSDQQEQRYDSHNYEKLLRLNICHQAIFYHQSLFRHARYDLRYPVCADWDFNLKCFRPPVHPLYVNKIIANYSLAGKSARWYHNPEYLQHFSDIRQMILRYRGRPYLFVHYLTRLLNRFKRAFSLSGL